MSPRAIVLGLLGGCFVCGVTYFNDVVMDQTYFIGNYMPIGIYGSLLLVLLLLNPLMWRLSRRLALSGRELAVALVITLAACCIPGPGLMRAFTATQILPHHYNRTEPGWKSQNVLDMVPRPMLADVDEQNEATVLSGFIQGLATTTVQKHITLFDIPWSAWSDTLLFWVALMFAFWCALIALSVVVHRQWSQHEQLSYPIATFADSLLPAEGDARGGVFRNRLFWIAAGGVLLLHVNNMAAANFPDHLIPIRTQFNLMPIAQLFPTLLGGFTKVLLVEPTIFFTVIAIAYFLSSQVSLSLGVGPFLYCAALGVFGSYGVSLIGGGYLEPKGLTFTFFGAFVGMFLGVLYMGRHYYRRVFTQAVLPRRGGDGGEHTQVRAARVFLISVCVFAGILTWVGVDWYLAGLYTGLLVMIFLVQSRIVAETGAFFIRAYWWPCVALAGLLGTTALDPKTYLILMLVTTVFALDPREALMPFMANSLKLLERRSIPIGRTAMWCGLSLVLGLAVALPLTLYFQYDRGVDKTDTRAIVGAPKQAYDEAVRVKQKMAAAGTLDKAQGVSGLNRLLHVRPNTPCVVGFAAGLLLVGVFTYCRLRFAWWPLHPVLFLIWHNYPGGVMAVSFLLGWFIKTVVTRYGGPRYYQKLKPFMIGLIAGDMLGGITALASGAITYLITGRPPMAYNFMPA